MILLNWSVFSYWWSCLGKQCSNLLFCAEALIATITLGLLILKQMCHRLKTTLLMCAGCWEPYIKYKEQNRIDSFLSMQWTNRGLFTTVAWIDCYEALIVSRHPLVYSLADAVLLNIFKIGFPTSFLRQYCVGIFKESALWADSFYELKCPYVGLFVCLFVCLSHNPTPLNGLPPFPKSNVQTF